MSDQPPILEIKVVADDMDSGSGSSSSQRAEGSSQTPAINPQQVPTAPTPPQQPTVVPSQSTPQNASTPATGVIPTSGMPSVSDAQQQPMEKLSLELTKYRAEKNSYLMAQWLKARDKGTLATDFDVHEVATDYDRRRVEQWAKRDTGVPSKLMDVVSNFASNDYDPLKYTAPGVIDTIQRSQKRVQREAGLETDGPVQPIKQPEPEEFPIEDFARALARRDIVGAGFQLFDAHRRGVQIPGFGGRSGGPVTPGGGGTGGGGVPPQNPGPQPPPGPQQGPQPVPGPQQPGLPGMPPTLPGMSSVIKFGLALAATDLVLGRLTANVSTLIERGVIPATKAYLEYVPLVRNWVMLFDAVEQRSQMDLQKYGPVSPQLQSNQMLNSALRMMNQQDILFRRGMFGGQNLNEQLIERQNVNLRWDNASDRIEGALSKVVNATFLPWSKRATVLLEKIAGISDFTGDALAAAITVAQKEALIQLAGGNSSTFGLLIRGLITWLDAEAQNAADAKAAKLKEAWGSLESILYAEEDQDPNERENKRKRGPNMPRGQWGKGKNPPPLQ